MNSPANGPNSVYGASGLIFVGDVDQQPSHVTDPPAMTRIAIRVLLVEDHAIVRDGIAALLSGEASLELVLSASSATRRWRDCRSSVRTWPSSTSICPA